MTSVRETFSESFKMPRTVASHAKTPKIPSVSQLSSQSYSFQLPDVSAGNSSEDVRQKTLWTVDEGHSSPSPLNMKRFSELSLLESSTEQAIPSFGSDVSTATQKEMYNLPSKSRDIDVHQQKLSESPVKHKFSFSVARATQSTVTSAKLPSTPSKLPGFVFTRTTVAIFPTIRPSPVSTKDLFATTRQSKSPTHSIGSASSSVVSGVAIPSYVVCVGTVSIYGSEKGFSDKKLVQASPSKDKVLDGSSLKPFTSHSKELAINTSSTTPYPGTSLQKTRHVVTDIFPTPFFYSENSTVVNSSSPSALDQTSIMGSTKIRSLTPLINLDNPSVISTRILRDYKTEEIGTFSRNEPLTPSLAFGAKMTSLMETSQQQSVQGSPTSNYKSSVRLKPDSTIPLKENSTFLFWKRIIDKSLDPRETSSFGPVSLSQLITETSIFENATEAFSSSPLVLSAIDYLKTPEVIYITKSRTTGQSEETGDLRSLVSGTLTTNTSLKRSPSRLIVPPSVSILQTAKLPSTPFVVRRKASLPSSSVIKSSAATEGGYFHFTTLASILLSVALTGETISEPVYSIEKLTSRPHVQSSRSTRKTSKFLLRTQATQITSSPSTLVAKHDNVYFTSSSYPHISSPLKRQAMTHASSSQRTQSFTLLAETSTVEEEAITSHVLSRQGMLSSLSALQDSKRRETPLSAELFSPKPRPSILKSSSEFQGDSRFLETSPPLSFISTFTAENTDSLAFVDNLEASSSQELSSSSPHSSSSLRVEAIASLWASKTTLASKHEVLSPPRLHFSLTRKLATSINHVLDMDSLSSSSSLQRTLLSEFSQSRSTQEIEPTQSHLYSLKKGIPSSMSSPFSSSLNVEATKSFLDSSTSSILLKFSPSQKVGALTGALDALRSSSSGQHTRNTMFPQLSSALEEKVTTSPISSWTSLPSRHRLKEESPVASPVDSLQSSSSSQYILLSPSIPPSSALKFTMGYSESSASLLSRQQIPSPVYACITSVLRVESTIGVVDLSRYSSSKRQIPSLPSLLVSSAPKVEITSSFMDSLTPSPSKHQMASLSSPQFSSGSKIQITGGIMDSATTSSSKHDMLSLMSSSAPKVELKTDRLSSFATSSSNLEMRSSPSPQLSSMPKYEVTKSLSDSLSNHEIQPSLSPKASSTSNVADAISLMNSSRTSSWEHEMQSLMFSQFSSTSKLEVATSLMDAVRMSLSRHEMQPLLPTKVSSTPKLEVTTSITDSMRTSLPKDERQPLLSTPKFEVTTTIMDAMRKSLSKHEMHPLRSPKESSTSKLEVTTSLMDSTIASSEHEIPLLPSPLVNSIPTIHVELLTIIMASSTTSSSMESISSLSSPQATSAPKVELITSPLESFTTSLSKSSPSPLSSSASKVEMKTSAMDLFSISSLKQRKPSLPPQLLSSGARILEDSITSSPSHHPPLPNIEFTTAIIGSFTASLSKQEMPSLASPHATSLRKVEFTTHGSLMESFRTSLSSSTLNVEIKTSVMDLFPSSSIRHETPSSSTLPLSSEVTTRIQEDPLTSSSLHHHQILEVASTKSLNPFFTSLSSSQQVISSFSPRLSSLVKVEAPDRLLNSSTALSSRQRSLSSTFGAESLTSSLSRQHILSSSPQLSPSLTAEAATATVDSVINLSSRKKILLSQSSQLNLSLEAEYTSGLKDSLRSFSSRQSMLSSTAPQFSSALKVDATTSHTEAMPTSSLSRSVKFTSLVGSFTSSLTEQYILLSVSTAQTSGLPTKPSAGKFNSFPIPSIFSKEDYTIFTTSSSSLFSVTPTLELSQRFLISSSYLYTSALQERSTADLSVSNERHFTNSLEEGYSSLTLVSREESHQTVTATMDPPSIPSSALKTHVSKMVLSSSEPASVKMVAAPTPTTVQEEKRKLFSECGKLKC